MIYIDMLDVSAKVGGTVRFTVIVDAIHWSLRELL
jgi:hypothetical protein